MPPAEMVASEAGKMVGLAAGGWLVMFGKKGPVNGEVVYRARKAPAEHLVVDLTRGGRYKISGPAARAKTLTAGREGVLQFRVDKPGEVKITPVK